MSIATAITNAQTKINSAYTAVSDMGGTVSSSKTLANLPTAIKSIPKGSTELPDALYLEKEIVYSSTSTSGAKTIFSAAELVAAGILSATNKELTTEWNNYHVVWYAKMSSHTASSSGIIMSEAFSNYIAYNGTTAYRRRIEYHPSNSSTSATRVGNANAITQSTSGYLYSSASNGIRLTPSSTYRQMAGTYIARIVVWGRK